MPLREVVKDVDGENASVEDLGRGPTDNKFARDYDEIWTNRVVELGCH